LSAQVHKLAVVFRLKCC